MNSTQRSLPERPNAVSWGFAEDHVPVSEPARRAHEEAVLAGSAPISNGVASLLTLLARTVYANTVVEIGTGFGASGLALLAGMAETGVLTSIDAEAENQLPVKDLMSEAGYSSSRYRLIAGSPLEVLPKLRDAAYDMVFVNGDKLEYVEYVAAAGRLLRPGGLLVVHDVLWDGAVADPDDESDEAIIIREALEAITAAESYTQALVPSGNGLLIAVKG